LADLANQRVEGDDGFNSAVEKSLSDYDNKLIGDNRPPGRLPTLSRITFSIYQPTNSMNLENLLKPTVKARKRTRKGNICCFVLHRFICATAKLSCHSFEYCYRI
jgi:hypothetical protein